MANEIQFVLYNIDQEDIKVKVAVQDETLWATQRGMADLFDVSIPTINEHLKNIYESKELDKESTIRNFRIVQIEGTRQVSVFATYILQFVLFGRKYFVMSKKNSTFVAERRRRRNELVATTAACGIRRPLFLLLPRSHELLGRENVKWKQQNTY